MSKHENYRLRITVWLGETFSGLTKVNPQVTMENFQLMLFLIVQKHLFSFSRKPLCLLVASFFQAVTFYLHMLRFHW